MNKLKELKAAAMAKLDAAYVARGAACDVDYAAAAAAVDAAIDAAWDAAIDAYQTKEDKTGEL